MSSLQAEAFADLPGADLVVDRIYLGGSAGNRADDPLHPLLGVGNAGGFRYRGSISQETLPYVVLYSTGLDPDWPDTLDARTGVFTYYGDNKRPGQGLHETPRHGNEILRRAFARAGSGAAQRCGVPPFLLFGKASPGSSVRFQGLLAPGSDAVTPAEQLVALWRSSSGLRFQNYRAIFTVLDAPVINRSWISDLQAGQPLSRSCPPAWRAWAESGSYHALAAPPGTQHRSKAQQMPASAADVAILHAVHQHFAPTPHAFEYCAARLWQMMAPAAEQIEVTRPSRDGGRDAVGRYALGPAGDRVLLDFALEAKCYAPANAVGVRETSRLISRIRHRQFGVLVTTSYVHEQAYSEIRADGHPIVIISGLDIVQLLRARGLGSPGEVSLWLAQEFPT